MRNKTSITLVAALAFALASQANANARTYSAKFQGRDVVVHKNALPVILHRLVPPNYGRHITEREYLQGQSGRGASIPASTSFRTNAR